MAKQKYRIDNWSEYNNSLKARGRIDFWVSEEVLASWKEPKKEGKVSRPKEYSDSVIILALRIRTLWNLPLRATEGFLKSLFKLMNVDLAVPDYTLMCKRQKTVKLPELKAVKSKAITDVVIDSTGVKVYGEGEWKVNKHGADKKRKWHKIHLGIDPETGEIIAEKTTDNDTGDCEVLPELLNK